MLPVLQMLFDSSDYIDYRWMTIHLFYLQKHQQQSKMSWKTRFEQYCTSQQQLVICVEIREISTSLFFFFFKL